MTTTPYDREFRSQYPEAPRSGNGRAERMAAEAGKSIGSLFRELLDKTRALLQDELRLAKAELREQLELLGRNLVWVGIGGGLALAAILVLSIALNRGLTVLFAQFMDPEIAVWLVPLLLGMVLAGIGAALIMKGVNTLRQHMNLVPEKTKQTLKEDREWLRQKVT